MTSVHVIIVPQLYSLSKPINLQIPPHTVQTSFTTVGGYLPIPLDHAIHLVKTSKICEQQIVCGEIYPLQVPSVSFY